MIKNVHLGFFISEYNKGPIYLDLATFKDANELDHFMDYFYNNNEKIRKLFDQDISEYAIDNIDQFRKVEKVTNNNFRGRISAYYFNELGKIEFLDLPTSKKKPVRDYKTLPNLKECYSYLCKVFNDAEQRIKERYKKTQYGPPKGEFIHYICEKLKQASYYMSQNEVYYLAKYFNHQTEKNKEACLTLLRNNLKQYYVQKEKEELLEKQYEEDKKLALETPIEKEEKLTSLDGAREELEIDVEKVNMSRDYDHLFLNHDLDEIDKYTNALRKGR